MISTHTQKHSCKLVITHQEAEEGVPGQPGIRLSFALN